MDVTERGAGVKLSLLALRSCRRRYRCLLRTTRETGNQGQCLLWWTDTREELDLERLMGVGREARERFCGRQPRANLEPWQSSGSFGSTLKKNIIFGRTRATPVYDTFNLTSTGQPSSGSSILPCVCGACTAIVCRCWALEQRKATPFGDSPSAVISAQPYFWRANEKLAIDCQQANGKPVSFSRSSP